MKRPNLNDEMAAFLKQFEPYSRDYFERKIRQSRRVSPLISRFYRELSDFSSGGKRMRAFLVYLGYVVGGKNGVLRILPISLAIEIVHSFLLIHDDIIDKSETRRGKATIHKIFEKEFGSYYGISQAIILGDIACFEALELINNSDFKESEKVACVKQVLLVLRETGYGEALDVESTYRLGSGSLRLTRQVMDLKTARYSFVGPLTFGAILGGAGSDRIRGLTKFGLASGMAFQLKDDILGVFGDEKITGKPTDIHEGKNTMLIYKTYELASLKDRVILRKIWGNKSANSADLNSVRKIVENCGALGWCEKEQSRLIKKAKVNIKDITDDIGVQVLFGQIADFVISRGK